MKLTKEDRENLKIFISKSSVNARKYEGFEIFEHRAWKALQKILPLFSKKDQGELRDAYSNRHEVIMGYDHPFFYEVVSEVYKKNGIDPKSL